MGRSLRSFNRAGSQLRSAHAPSAGFGNGRARRHQSTVVRSRFSVGRPQTVRTRSGSPEKSRSPRNSRAISTISNWTNRTAKVLPSYKPILKRDRYSNACGPGAPSAKRICNSSPASCSPFCNTSTIAAPPSSIGIIKPSNILLGDRSGHDVGSVYLVDFGSVRAIAAREDSTVTVVGTYGYMPPEQFGGRSVPATDLYALGATIVYLATGERPSDLPQKDLRIQFESRARLSRSFARWLQRMVEPSLDCRFRSATEALQALDQPFNRKRAAPRDRQPSRGQQNRVVPGRQPPGDRFATARFRLESDPQRFGSLLLRTVRFFRHHAHDAPHLPRPALQWFSSIGGSLVGDRAVRSLAWGLELYLLCRTLFLLFGKVRFRADARQASIFWQLWFFRWRARSGARQDISQIVRSQGGIRSAKHGEFSRADRIEVPSEVALWVGTKKYVIGCGPEQTSPELHWLAAELGRFLKLPVRDR